MRLAFVASAALTTSLLATTLSSRLAAQPSSLPHRYLTVPGSSSTNWPFGLSGPSRVQYLYRRDLIPGPAVVVTQIAVRGDEASTRAGKTIELEIGMSHSATSPFNASMTFLNNHGQDYVVVLGRRTVNLPTQVGGMPAPFLAQFPLDNPFVIVRSLGNPLIDYVVTQNQSGTYPSDCEYNGIPGITTIGASCGTLSQAISGGRAVSASSTTTFDLSGAASMVGAVHVLGASPLPAPFPLPLGGCPLYVSPDFLSPATTSVTGDASVTFPTPVGTRNLRSTLYGQWLTVTASQWQSSDAQELKIGGYLPCVRIYDTSSATSLTGRVQIGVAVVHELR